MAIDNKTYITPEMLELLLGKIKAAHVLVEEGKGLSTNDLTDELLAKLNDAQANVLESVKVNGEALEITEKGVDIAVPTTVSQLTNDAGYITLDDVPEGVAASDVDPLMDGTAAAGTAVTYARADHVHPTDTSRASATELANEVTRATEAEEALGGRIDTLGEKVTANETAIGVLNADANTAGSVDKKVADAINAFATQITDDGTINTYKEALEYISTHGAEYTALLGKVTANETAIATLNGDAQTAGSVDKKIADAVAALNIDQYATDDDLAGVDGKVTALDTKVGAIPEGATATTVVGYVDEAVNSAMVALTEDEINAIWNRVYTA